MLKAKQTSYLLGGSLSGSIIFSMASVVTLGLSPVQQVSAQGSVLEEVTVTARKYEESLQDVPVSVNAMSAEFLESQGIGKVSDVIEFSPGTTFIRFNKLQDEYSMRGSSSQTEGSSGDSSVQSVIDNVVVSKDFMKNPAFFDIERVEILRGPQGTTFGRNASAGLVHIITKRPTQEFEAGVTLGAGSHESFNVDGYFSGSITENLAGRLAFNFDTYDGYTESTSTGKGLDGQENTSVRGSLLFTPSDSLQIYLKAEYGEDDDEAPVRRALDCSLPQTLFVPPGPPVFHPTFGGGTAPPGSPLGAGGPAGPNSAPITSFADYTDSCDVWKTEISSGSDFFLKRDILNLTAEVVWSMNDNLTLTWVTGYLDGDSDYLLEAQGTPSSILFQNTTNDAESFTQEFRLDNHAGAGRLRWLAGIYYLNDEHDRFDENRFYDTVISTPGPVGRSANNPLTLDTKISTSETEAFGLFGELDYDITDNLTGTFGIRWSTDEKDYAVAHTAIGWAPKATGFVEDTFGTCVFPGPPGFVNTGCTTTIGFGTADSPAGNPQTPVTATEDWDNISIKASLQYAMTDEHMAYILYSEGYKTGGFQPEPFNAADAAVPFNEETSRNYELGFKGDFLGRFRLNASIFYTKYSDLQITQFLQVPGGFRALIANAGGAETFGLELEYIWQVTDNFRLSGSYADLDTEFVNTILFQADDVNGGNVLTDLSGTRPDNTIDWTGTAVAEYTVPFATGSALTLRVDWRGRSDSFDDVGEQADRLRPAADVFGARLTWTAANEKWSASVWGKNLFEEEQILNIGPAQPDTVRHPIAFGAPRTLGGTISYSY